MREVELILEIVENTGMRESQCGKSCEMKRELREIILEIIWKYRGAGK